MNKDQLQGNLKDAAGQVQEKVGVVVGSREQQLKGIVKQAEGQAQKALGDVKEVVQDVHKK